jgi:hypothetical protein
VKWQQVSKHLKQVSWLLNHACNRFKKRLIASRNRGPETGAGPSCEEDTSQHLTDYEFSKTIRTETVYPDGSKTVTITDIYRDEENMDEI